MANTTLPSPAKPITIDAQGFTLSGIYNAATVGSRGAVHLSGPFPSGSQITFSGVLVAGSAGPAGTTSGQTGIWLNQSAAAVNNGSVTGGAGGSGETGVRIFSNSSLTNNGVIQGGDSAPRRLVEMVSILAVPRIGTGTIVNTGTIEGGAGAIAIVNNTVSASLEPYK
ncbi:hypothetical protein J2X72_004311 [Phyllobacterium sp. 1468]|uniref:hypothetical protein n=1 Tax=Phyllobacterium sp. 1468 TaxID=2817759 RepID=UPI00286797AA|nr:hypothetical protein [Phyllobacterium sp. 1468]MDR6635497.1 hypothetical protein [Phyllobacterium sp. 1468]